ncbi:MAG: PilW family protein [Rhodocyclaceae bacterium]
MSRMSFNRAANQQGLTLIELMVTIVIALLLLAVIGSVYLAGKRSFNYQNATGRVQERARFAMEQISQSIRGIGFQGCGSLTTKVGNMTWNASWDSSLPNAEAHWWLLNAVPLRAYSTIPSSAPSSDFAAAETSKGDLLITLHPDTTTEHGITSAVATADAITITDTTAFANGDILVAYDCSRLVVFQKTGGTTTTIQHAASGSPGNCQGTFDTTCATGGTSFGLSAGGFVSKLTAEAYYIAPASSGNGSSLWRRRSSTTSSGANTTVAEEIVPGIEGLRVRLGMDTNNDKAADRYVRPESVGTSDWGNVVGARIELLAVSDEAKLASTAQTGIQLDGDATARNTSDRRLYRVYSSTINLRNRTY